MAKLTIRYLELDLQGHVHSGSISPLTPLREGEPVPAPKPPIGFRLRDGGTP